VHANLSPEVRASARTRMSNEEELAGGVRFMRRRDLAIVVVFSIFWLAPLLYEGVVRAPLHAWMPEGCYDMYRSTCLFLDESEHKLEFYVQGAARDGEWMTLRDADYTPMQPFGYVNRNWALLHSVNNVMLEQFWLDQQPRTDENRQRFEEQERALERRRPPARELAAWYRRKYQAKHPDRPRLASVRFLAVWHPVGSEIATPPGHWTRSEVEDIPKERISVIFQRHFGGS
jgi:hypothetical protein